MWILEGLWLGVPSLALAVAAWSLGWEWSLGLAAGLAVYAFRALRQLATLNRWLGIESRAGGENELPAASGLWQLAFERMQRWHRIERSEAAEHAGAPPHWRRFIAAWEDGWIETDRGHRIVRCNPAAQRILALGEPPEPGASLLLYFRAPEFVSALASIDANASHAALRIDDYPAMRCRLHCRLLDLGSRRAVWIRDLTAARRQQGMQDDFVANVSHELCTPLSVLVGHMELLAEDLGPGADARLAPMSAQLDKLQRLIDSLAGMAQLSDRAEAAWEVVDVAELLAATAANLAALAGTKRRVDIACEAGLALFGERDVLEGAIGNLLVNAIHHTEPDGHIQIAGAREADGGARLSVQDDGVGIGAEHLPRLTERFYRVDPSRHGRSGGFGLGLSIVQHALDKHQATLKVDSKPHAGSAFRCHFPAARVVGGQDATSGAP